MLKSTGPVIKSKTTGAIYQNPYLAVANRAMKQMRDFLTEFGMTPSSRSRVSSGLPPVRDEKVEKFFGWCNRG
jgi:P27 family predicted phage terminase small subunit